MLRCACSLSFHHHPSHLLPQHPQLQSEQQAQRRHTHTPIPPLAPLVARPRSLCCVDVLTAWALLRSLRCRPRAPQSLQTLASRRLQACSLPASRPLPPGPSLCSCPCSMTWKTPTETSSSFALGAARRLHGVLIWARLGRLGDHVARLVHICVTHAQRHVCAPGLLARIFGLPRRRNLLNCLDP